MLTFTYGVITGLVIAVVICLVVGWWVMTQMEWRD